MRQMHVVLASLAGNVEELRQASLIMRGPGVFLVFPHIINLIAICTLIDALRGPLYMYISCEQRNNIAIHMIRGPDPGGV